jgi:hypothetical protein
MRLASTMPMITAPMATSAGLAVGLGAAGELGEGGRQVEERGDRDEHGRHDRDRKKPRLIAFMPFLSLSRGEVP